MLYVVIGILMAYLLVLTYFLSRLQSERRDMILSNSREKALHIQYENSLQDTQLMMMKVFMDLHKSYPYDDRIGVMIRAYMNDPYRKELIEKSNAVLN